MKIEIIREKLKELSESEYAKFNKKLCPDTKKQILGIRIPKLRILAKEIFKTDYKQIPEPSKNRPEADTPAALSSWPT